MLNLEVLGRVLIGLAVILLIAGVLLVILGRVGIVKVPGDILLRRGNLTVFFPIVTAIIVSIILTVLINLIGWLWRR